MIIVPLLIAAATVDVLTASSDVVNLVETRTVHFVWLLNCVSFLQNKQSRPRLLVLANFITCLPSGIPLDLAFMPSILQRVRRWQYRV